MQAFITINLKNNISQLTPCPQCKSSFTYEDAELYIFQDSAHKWSKTANEACAKIGKVIGDANGNVLRDGDTITVIKDLKIKGYSSVVKLGTKVKNIRLVNEGHDTDCKTDGFGAMKLK